MVKHLYESWSALKIVFEPSNLILPIPPVTQVTGFFYVSSHGQGAFYLQLNFKTPMFSVIKFI